MDLTTFFVVELFQLYSLFHVQLKLYKMDYEMLLIDVLDFDLVEDEYSNPIDSMLFASSYRNHVVMVLVVVVAVVEEEVTTLFDRQVR